MTTPTQSMIYSAMVAYGLPYDAAKERLRLESTKAPIFIELDWTVGVYRFRIGQSFTDFRGVRSLPSLKEWRAFLAEHGMRIGTKTDSRTWRVVPNL